MRLVEAAIQRIVRKLLIAAMQVVVQVVVVQVVVQVARASLCKRRISRRENLEQRTPLF